MLLIGVKCVVFLNEVGIGMVLFVYGVVKMSEFVCEGLVVMIGFFIDMIFVCILMVFVILILGVSFGD